MMKDLPTRPTTEAERALVERMLRADQSVSRSTVAVSVGLGVVLPGVALSWEEPAGAMLFGLIGFGSAAVFWWMSKGARNRKVLDSTRAIRLDGPVEGKGWGLDDIQTHNRLAVGGQVVTVPAHWRSYVARSEPHAVWTVETTGAPVAVAVERGPSADADAAFGADCLLDQRLKPGRYAASALGVTALALACLALVVGFDVPPLVLTLAFGAFIWGGTSILADGRVRSRLHRAYFEGGARFAPNPAVRRRLLLFETALSAGGVGIVSVLIAAVNDVPKLPFAAVGVLYVAAASQFRRSEPAPDPKNVGSGALRPAAP